jgi:hypothetical protein
MTAATMARPGRTLPASAIRLLIAARSALADAAEATDSGERYAAAHLAALRTAAVILADRTRPADSRVRRPTSAWALLTGVAPELGEWAAYFAAGAAKRAAAEAGIRSAVTAREADDLIRDSTIFLQLVETTLGVLPGTVSRVG